MIIEDHRKHEYKLVNHAILKINEHQTLSRDVEKWLAAGNQIKPAVNNPKANTFNHSNPEAIKQKQTAKAEAKKRVVKQDAKYIAQHIKNRIEAKTLGLKKFESLACKHDGTTTRYTSNNACVSCSDRANEKRKIS